MGIVIDASEAYKTYADSIGIAANALTNQQRQEAFAQAAIKSASDLAESSGRVYTNILKDSDNALVATRQLTKAWDDFKVSFGELVSPGVTDALQALKSLIDGAKYVVELLTIGGDRVRLISEGQQARIPVQNLTPAQQQRLIEVGKTISEQTFFDIKNIESQRRAVVRQIELFENQVEYTLRGQYSNVDIRPFLKELFEYPFTLTAQLQSRTGDLNQELLRSIENAFVLDERLAQLYDRRDRLTGGPTQNINQGPRGLDTGRAYIQILKEIQQREAELLPDQFKVISDLFSAGAVEDLKYFEYLKGIEKASELRSKAIADALRLRTLSGELTAEVVRRNTYEEYGLTIGGKILSNYDEQKFAIQARNNVLETIAGAVPELSLDTELIAQGVIDESALLETEQYLRDFYGLTVNLTDLIKKEQAKLANEALNPLREFFSLDFTRSPAFSGLDQLSLRRAFLTPEETKNLNDYTEAYKEYKRIVLFNPEVTGDVLADSAKKVDEAYDTLTTRTKNLVGSTKELTQLTSKDLPNALKGLGPILEDSFDFIPEIRADVDQLARSIAPPTYTQGQQGLNALRRELGVDFNTSPTFQRLFQFNPEEWERRFGGANSQLLAEGIQNIWERAIDELETTDETKEKLRTYLGLDSDDVESDSAFRNFGENLKESSAQFVADIAVASGNYTDALDRLRENIIRSLARSLIDAGTSAIGSSEQGLFGRLVKGLFGAGTTNIAQQTTVNVAPNPLSKIDRLNAPLTKDTY